MTSGGPHEQGAQTNRKVRDGRFVEVRNPTGMENHREAIRPGGPRRAPCKGDSMNRDLKPVASLAEMAHALDMEKRVSTLEAIIPTLATKADLANLRADLEKGQKENRTWMLASVLGMVVAILTAGGFYTNQISRAVERATERSLNAERTAERAAAAVERIEERLSKQDRSDP